MNGSRYTTSSRRSTHIFRRKPLNPDNFFPYLFSEEGIGWKTDATRFANEINACFVEEGIGWQLVDGQMGLIRKDEVAGLR